MTPRAIAAGVFWDALRALDPRALTARAAGVLAASAASGTASEGVLLLGAGKAAGTMAAGVLDALGERVVGGLVVVKDATEIRGVQVRVAAHPWPDERSEAAGRELLARAASANVPVVFVLSGGASALAAVPAAGLSLGDKVAATRAVAAAGASIQELNTVRRHLSAIKGGRLARACRMPLTALVLSDVIGDDLVTIGGGPLTDDPTTGAEALAVIDRLGVVVPPAVRARLAADMRAAPGRQPHARVTTRVLAGPDDLVTAAEMALAARGVIVVGVERRVGDDVAPVAQRLAARAVALARTVAPGERRAFVAGGEPTIRIAAAQPGRGGRAQHLALLVARELAAARELTAAREPAAARTLATAPTDDGVALAVLCTASDGSDGPTADAGGLVDAGTWGRAAAAGVDPAAALAAFDAGTALAAAGDLVTTGPTGSNLADLFVIVATRRP